MVYAQCVRYFYYVLPTYMFLYVAYLFPFQWDERFPVF